MQGDRRRGVGRRGEALAANRLEHFGYEVVARNHRTRYGEIDLIARKGSTLVFFEVKTLVIARTGREGPRVGPAYPLEAVGRAKREQVRKLARAWLSETEGAHRRYSELRFDAIGIVLSPAGEILEVDHVENAF
jgi:putative endonuclease